MAETRRAYRDPVTGVVAGVCTGLAEHFGLPVLAVRLAFIVTTVVFHGLGALAYGAFWIFLPTRAQEEVTTDDATPAGIASATREGRRARRQRKLGDLGVLVALCVVGVGLWLMIRPFAVHGWAWALWAALIAVGVGLLWRQADEAQRERWLRPDGRLNVWRMAIGSGSFTAWLRLVLGALLLSAGFVLLLVFQGGSAQFGMLILAFILGLVGIGIVLAPWLIWLLSDLSAERAERIRSQERADVAAHLHDSVLQTLALIQRSADDAGRVTTLARAQERELRDWLFQSPSERHNTLAEALQEAAHEVEAVHGVPIEVVTVGDADCTDSLRAVVAAAREAMTNAAVHAGAPQVDVYAEVSETEAQVFVKDRGKGFAKTRVPDGRMGIKESIVGRMERHGGSAAVRSAKNRGTEWKLVMPL